MNARAHRDTQATNAKLVGHFCNRLAFMRVHWGVCMCVCVCVCVRVHVRVCESCVRACGYVRENWTGV